MERIIQSYQGEYKYVRIGLLCVTAIIILWLMLLAPATDDCCSAAPAAGCCGVCSDGGGCETSGPLQILRFTHTHRSKTMVSRALCPSAPILHLRLMLRSIRLPLLPATLPTAAPTTSTSSAPAPAIQDNFMHGGVDGGISLYCTPTSNLGNRSLIYMELTASPIGAARLVILLSCVRPATTRGPFRRTSTRAWELPSAPPPVSIADSCHCKSYRLGMNYYDYGAMLTGPWTYAVKLIQDQFPASLICHSSAIYHMHVLC